MCSRTDRLPGRDAVPEHLFAMESEGAFSTSPKTQTLPRTTRHGAEHARLDPDTAAQGRSTTINPHIPYFKPKAEQATALTDSTAQLHRLQPLFVQALPGKLGCQG